jgi:hypothetical protein
LEEENGRRARKSNKKKATKEDEEEGIKETEIWLRYFSSTWNGP